MKHIFVFVAVIAIVTATLIERNTEGWISEEAEPRSEMHVSLGISSRNKDKLEDTFWRVSDPFSVDYGKHLTVQQIAAISAPSAQDHALILNWLRTNGILNAEILAAQDFIRFSAPVATIERLFSTRIQKFTHVKSNTVVHRAIGEYHMPEDVSALVAYIAGLTRLPTAMRPQLTQLGNDAFVVAGNEQVVFVAQVLCPGNLTTTNLAAPCSEHGATLTTLTLTSINIPNYPSRAAITATVTAQNCLQPNAAEGDMSVYCGVPVSDVPNYLPVTVPEITATFSDGTSNVQTTQVTGFAGKWTTPQVLSAAYNVPPGTVGTNPTNSMAVAEFLGQYYSPSDLNGFFHVMSLPNMTTTVIGFNDPTNPGGEATLDIEYLMGVARNVRTEFWSTAGGSSSGEPYIQWLSDLAAAATIPWVHSISYGDLEMDWSDSDKGFICDQFMKVGLRGVSLVFSSGDDGVGNFKARNDTKYCSPFTPAFPATCPYVTVVGGTQFSTQISRVCEQSLNMGGSVRLSCDAVGEVACSSDTGGVISSGGGFSNFFTRPAYQDSAVQTFFTAAAAQSQLPPPMFFNASGRGFPDVATNAHNYLILMGGQMSSIHGTSAAAPTFAALVTLLNDARLNLNQPTLGFLNPWLYAMAQQHPEAFTDITRGNNRCTANMLSCCAEGFHATYGWDPVTGLGTPNFEVLRNLILNPDVMYPTSGAGQQGAQGPAGPQGPPGTAGRNAMSPWIATIPVSVILLITVVVLAITTVTVFKMRRGSSGATEVSSLLAN